MVHQELRAGVRPRRATPRPGGLERRRLNSVLGLAKPAGIVLVTAGPGTGKTTAVSHWAQSLHCTVGWHRVDRTDTLADILAALAGSAGWGAPPGYRPTDHRSPDHSPTDLTPASLADLAAGQDQPPVLIVDAVENLSAGAAADLEGLARALTGVACLVLVGRSGPAWNVARAELAAPVSIREGDLRFRAWEVELLFAEHYRLPLRTVDAVDLTRRTAGWPAALALFRGSLEDTTPAALGRSIAMLEQRCDYAATYLDEQILSGLSPDTRTFLRRTAALDVLTVARCNHLLNSSVSEQTLRSLRKQPMLLRPADSGRGFTQHPVVRQHLLTELSDQLGEVELRRWLTRAADVVEGDGVLAETLAARCRARDWYAVRQLLGEHGGVVARARTAEWVDLLPEWLFEVEPWAGLAHAGALFENGSLDAAAAAAELARSRFDHPAGRRAADVMLQRYAAWTEPDVDPSSREGLLRAAVGGDPIGVAARAQLSTSEFRLVCEGVARVLAGQREQALAVLQRCAADPTGEPPARSAARLLLAAISDRPDNTARRDSDVDHVLVDAERNGQVWLARLTGAVALADTAPSRAGETTAELLGYCDASGDTWGAALVALIAVLAQLSAGVPDPAGIQDLADRFAGLGAGVLETWMRSVADVAPELAGAGGTVKVWSLLGPATSAPAVQLALPPRPVPLPGAPGTPGPSSTPGPSRAANIPGAPAVQISCLGRFALQVDGRPVDLSGVRPRARTALRYFALHAGRPLHRDLLAASLWPAHPEAAALHNLHVTVSSLRGLLEPGLTRRSSRLLIRDGETYQLVLGDGSYSDLRDFEGALRAAASARTTSDVDARALHLARALELYVGDVLPEDGAAEWVVQIREDYRLQAAQAAFELASLELARGNLAVAVSAAGHCTRIDRWHDGGWRRLIEACERVGDLAAARRAQRAYSDVLAELGVAD